MEQICPTGDEKPEQFINAEVEAISLSQNREESPSGKGTALVALEYPSQSVKTHPEVPK